MSRKWERVGEIGVDAGMCWVGDPCYIIGDNTPFKTWDGFCDQVPDDHDTMQWNYEAGRPGLGVSVESGYGDGVYPVYVRRSRDGRVSAVKVVFIPKGQ